MIATITKDFQFSAAHRLSGLPKGHQCSRVHGHNYIVRVEVEGEVNGPGFVVDYGDLKQFGDYIDREIDHRNLNDIMPDNPTAEYLARRLCAVLRAILGELDAHHFIEIGVKISETPKTWAIYREKW